MKISDIRATRVAVPLEAPLRHANGCRWGRFVRTIVEVKTDNGIVGLREMGGGESAQAVFRAMKSYFFEEIGNANQFPPPSRPGRLDAIFALAGRNLLLRMRS